MCISPHIKNNDWYPLNKRCCNPISSPISCPDSDFTPKIWVYHPISKMMIWGVIDIRWWCTSYNHRAIWGRKSHIFPIWCRYHPITKSIQKQWYVVSLMWCHLPYIITNMLSWFWGHPIKMGVSPHIKNNDVSWPFGVCWWYGAKHSDGIIVLKCTLIYTIKSQVLLAPLHEHLLNLVKLEFRQHYLADDQPIKDEDSKDKRQNGKGRNSLSTT